LQTPLSYDLQQLPGLVAEGNERAFAQLYQHYTNTVYGVALTYTKSKDLAEEIVQEVFLKLWLQRSRLAALDNFENYLFIMARNQILNQLKSKLRQQAYVHHLTKVFSDPALTPEDQLMFKEAGMLVKRAVDLLPPQQKLVYQMARQEGLALDLIARQLGLSRNTVRNHLAKAIETIRNYHRHHAEELVVLLVTLSLY
jgi:RNA polymerase sigma-70 factor (ECF subfamily)